MRDDLFDRLIDDRYEVHDLIHVGAMAKVYSAYDRRERRAVALKVVRSHVDATEEGRGRFEREAAALRELDHPQFVNVLGAGVMPRAEGLEEDFCYIVMELVEGQSLDELPGAQVDVRTCLAIIREVALVLAYIHDQGHVHRDVRPANIMVDGQFHVKLLDFGLTKSLNESARITDYGQDAPTRSFASPEQCRNDLLTPASDVFSLGAVAYELIGGRPAFSGYDPAPVMYHVLTADPPPLDEVRPDCPAEVAAIVARMLRKQPQERYTSAQELIDAINGWLAEAPAAARPLPPPAPRPVRPRPAPPAETAGMRTTPVAPPPLDMGTSTHAGGRRLPRIAIATAGLAAAAALIAVAWYLTRPTLPDLGELERKMSGMLADPSSEAVEADWDRASPNEAGEIKADLSLFTPSAQLSEADRERVRELRRRFDGFLRSVAQQIEARALGNPEEGKRELRRWESLLQESHVQVVKQAIDAGTRTAESRRRRELEERLARYRASGELPTYEDREKVQEHIDWLNRRKAGLNPEDRAGLASAIRTLAEITTKVRELAARHEELADADPRRAQQEISAAKAVLGPTLHASLLERAQATLDRRQQGRRERVAALKRALDELITREGNVVKPSLVNCTPEARRRFTTRLGRVEAEAEAFPDDLAEQVEAVSADFDRLKARIRDERSSIGARIDAEPAAAAKSVEEWKLVFGGAVKQDLQARIGARRQLNEAKAKLSEITVRGAGGAVQPHRTACTPGERKKVEEGLAALAKRPDLLSGDGQKELENCKKRLADLRKAVREKQAAIEELAKTKPAEALRDVDDRQWEKTLGSEVARRIAATAALAMQTGVDRTLAAMENRALRAEDGTQIADAEEQLELLKAHEGKLSQAAKASTAKLRARLATLKERSDAAVGLAKQIGMVERALERVATYGDDGRVVRCLPAATPEELRRIAAQLRTLEPKRKELSDADVARLSRCVARTKQINGHVVSIGEKMAREAGTTAGAKGALDTLRRHRALLGPARVTALAGKALGTLSTHSPRDGLTEVANWRREVGQEQALRLERAAFAAWRRAARQKASTADYDGALQVLTALQNHPRAKDPRLQDGLRGIEQAIHYYGGLRALGRGAAGFQDAREQLEKAREGAHAARATAIVAALNAYAEAKAQADDAAKRDGAIAKLTELIGADAVPPQIRRAAMRLKNAMTASSSSPADSVLAIYGSLERRDLAAAIGRLPEAAGLRKRLAGLGRAVKQGKIASFQFKRSGKLTTRRPQKLQATIVSGHEFRCTYGVRDIPPDSVRQTVTWSLRYEPNEGGKWQVVDAKVTPGEGK